ncbi:MAG TPA: AAA family ATPase [Rhizomicrobium sp.]
MTTLAKEIIVLGGPNGAGKTTTAKALLPGKIGFGEFVNADEIARALAPDDVESAAISAGRMMIERMNNLLAQDRSFAFETTCSGRGHIAFLKRAKQQGWRTFLLFVWLSSPELAIKRVALRVGRGGHNIPEEFIVRRYWKGLANFREGYLSVADAAAVYDNSAGEGKLVAEKTPEGMIVHDPQVWTKIQTAVP